jgi:hypothetical protein
MAYKTKGSWKIANLKGVERVFKDAEDPEAIAWMSNRDDKAPPKPKVVKPKKTV